jgi:hypothetical protein
MEIFSHELNLMENIFSDMTLVAQGPWIETERPFPFLLASHCWILT